MDTVERIKPKDKFVSVDGLQLRYIEEGSGPSLLFLHGASLGSSADVFLRNLGPFARAGFRAVAVDLHGPRLGMRHRRCDVIRDRNAVGAAALGHDSVDAVAPMELLALGLLDVLRKVDLVVPLRAHLEVLHAGEAPREGLLADCACARGGNDCHVMRSLSLLPQP